MPHISMLMPLLALLQVVFLPWQVVLALYVCIAIRSLAIARKVMQSQREPAASGPEAMMGDQAVVTTVGSQQAGAWDPHATTSSAASSSTATGKRFDFMVRLQS